MASSSPDSGNAGHGLVSLTNDAMRDELLRPGNLPALEEMLSTESERVRTLAKPGGKRNITLYRKEWPLIRTMKERRMASLCSAVQRDVESYLSSPKMADAECCCYDEQGWPVPWARYVPAPDPLSQKGILLMPPEEERLALPKLVHELTHHVTFSLYPEHLAFFQNDGKAFLEGLARGVELRLSRTYAEREGDSARPRIRRHCSCRGGPQEGLPLAPHQGRNSL